MSGRIRIRAADLAPEPGAAALDLASASGEAGLREALRAGLEAARRRGERRVCVLAPRGAAAGLPLQRCAEVLLDEARGHLAGATSIEEIHFLVEGEPSLRLFESVQDAARIAEQAGRWAP